jgi:tetratricopeptide (TPR) repeat protein
MGHCYTQQGRLDEALEAYSTALELNPHFGGIRKCVVALKKRLQ